MNQINNDIYELFTAIYRRVYEIEKELQLGSDHTDITCNDVRILMAIGIDEPRNMSAIARKRMVTVGSLTTAMNGLVRKGYVTRVRGNEDRRVIYLRLTEKGEAVYRARQKSYEELVERVMAEYTQEEAEALRELLSRAQHIM